MVSSTSQTGSDGRAAGSRPLRIACYQGPGNGTGAAGVLDALAEAAATTGADLLVSPEMGLTGYALGERAIRERAESMDGPLLERVATVARETGVSLLVGFPERDGDAIYNTVALVGTDGRLLASYRKTHLFGDVDRTQFAPGDAAPAVIEFCGVKTGILICYDVEFPETVRSLALAGAELVLVPTALMRPFEIVARAVVVSRAFENQVYLAYVNRCDSEASFDYCGLSCVIGPDGSELARAGDGEDVIVADIDTAVLTTMREKATHLTDRRPDLYHALVKPRV